MTNTFSLVALIFLIFWYISYSRHQEKERQEKIIVNGLKYSLQFYNTLKRQGMTEKEMVDKILIMQYTIDNMRARGMIE